MNKSIAQNKKFDLREAARYLPNADESAHLKFAERQFRSRQRFAELKAFYANNYCRMTQLHLLASCAVTLGRFAGFSKTFDEMGEHFMPLNRDGQPRTDDWQKFIEACEENLPVEVREELWLAAHFAEDFQTLKIDGELLMKPKTNAGGFFAHKILRRPKNLGSIHYTVRKK